MTLDELQGFVEAALNYPVPSTIMEFCGLYYSPYYNLMYLLAADHIFQNSRPAMCVELGVDQGRGSYSFLRGGARVIAVDNNTSKNCERITDRSNFTLIHGSSTPVPFPAERNMIDVLMIDTEHSWAQAESEFQAYKPHLKDGAIVLFDDTNAKEGEVRRYVESLLPYEKIFDDRLHPTCGFGAIIYRENV